MDDLNVLVASVDAVEIEMDHIRDRRELVGDCGGGEGSSWSRVGAWDHQCPAVTPPSTGRMVPVVKSESAR